MSLKRSREEIDLEYTRNVKAKRELEKNLAKLEKEKEDHPDTISEKLPKCTHFLVSNGRLTSFEINCTMHNYGWMKIETWICHFTLDGLVYIAIIARYYLKDKKSEWGTIPSLNAHNRRFFELLGTKTVEECDPFGIKKFRERVISGNIRPDDMWTEALERQYGNESRAIALLSHINYYPTEDETKVEMPKSVSAVMIGSK